MIQQTTRLAAAIAVAILAAGFAASPGAAQGDGCRLTVTGADGEARHLAVSDFEVRFSRRLTVILPTLTEEAGTTLRAFLESRVGEAISIAFAGVEVYDAWPVDMAHDSVGGLYLRPELWVQMRSNIEACPPELQPDLPGRPNEDG